MKGLASFLFSLHLSSIFFFLSESVGSQGSVFYELHKLMIDLRPGLLPLATDEVSVSQNSVEMSDHNAILHKSLDKRTAGVLVVELRDTSGIFLF